MKRALTKESFEAILSLYWKDLYLLRFDHDGCNNYQVELQHTYGYYHATVITSNTLEPETLVKRLDGINSFLVQSAIQDRPEKEIKWSGVTATERTGQDSKKDSLDFLNPPPVPIWANLFVEEQTHSYTKDADSQSS